MCGWRRAFAMVSSLAHIYVHVVLVVCVLAQEQTQVIHVLPDHQLMFNECQATECYYLTALMNNNIFSGNINTTIILYPGIHSISSAVNKVYSIYNATTLELTAANLSEGAIIKCNGYVGFAFSYCTNLTISGITFEGCGTHFINTHHIQQTVTSNFTLLISHSFDVHLLAILVRDGNGIGLLVVNVCGLLMLSDSGFKNNTCNFYYFSKDSVNTISSSTNVMVKNSRFGSATTCRHKDQLMGSVCSAGVVLKLLQTQFNVRADVTNVTLVKNQKYNIVIEFDFHTSKLTIENLTSLSVGNEFGMWILSASLSNKSCNEAPCTAVMMNHVNFRRGGLLITSKGRQNKEELDVYKYQMLLFNVYIESTQSQYPLFMSEIPRATVNNITIQNTTGTAVIKDCYVLLRGQFTYQQNYGSVILLGRNKIVIDSTTIIVQQNTAFLYAPFFITGSYIEMQNSTITFTNNTGSDSGGMILFNSTITFKGNSQMTFLYNKGTRGGAMTFYQKSELIFLCGTTTLSFVGNHASVKGGAIFVQDEVYVKYDYIRKITGIKYKNFYSSQRGKSKFYFSNNSAVEAGSAVYGGTVSNEFHFHSSPVNDTSVVSSVPFQVCKCTNSKPDCNITRISVTLLPGQSYELEAIAVGQEHGTVPSTIRAEFARQSSRGQLQQMEYVQSTGTHCTKLTYTVQFSSKSHLLKLTTISKTWKKRKGFKISFHRKECTVGFTYDTDEGRCTCNQVLTDHGIECDIQTLRVNRQSPKWISITYVHLPHSHQQSGVLVHDYCPFDYCIATGRITQPLDLLYPNQQCAFNRSGILCGECQTNFSHVLGTSKCKQCTKPWIALITPLIAIAGVALVVGLMLLNLTVSVGTINGLIFYVNIVRANQAIFFPHEMSNSFLSMFIAWLNLDLGIETCFYNGLDVYSKTWFQFLFPLYIWFMVMGIIVVSHYSTQASKLIGHNAVQVLATLFLLSYAKLLRIIITVFSSTELVYPDGYHRRVWLYDGNVDYFKGKHVPLFIAALLLLILVSFPFTATLLFNQCLQKLSNKRVLCWVGKLQPLFDAYTGPYKVQHLSLIHI